MRNQEDPFAGKWLRDDDGTDEEQSNDEDEGTTDARENHTSSGNDEVVAARYQLPLAFGKSTSGDNENIGKIIKQFHGAKVERLKSRTSASVGKGEEAEDADFYAGTSDDDVICESEEPHFIPSQFEINITAHENKKTVSAITLNPKASRMITGSLDGHVRMWDFNGMTTDMKWFRSFCPAEAHGIQSLDFSFTGSAFLCAAGESIVRLYDVDGKLTQKTVAGDMYVRDLNNTKGHTHMITTCQWHPFDRERFLTASVDATVRLWDINAKLYGIDQALPHGYCLKAVDRRNVNSQSCHVTCAKWAPSTGRFIVAGALDGSIQLWNEKKAYGRPDKIFRPPQTSNSSATSAITGLHIMDDEIKMFSRCDDNTLKLWDIRALKECVKCVDNLINPNPKTNVISSPNQQIILTASTDNPTTKTSGCIKCFSVNDLELINTLSVQDALPICVEWPHEINQLLIACTNGTVKALYDAKHSQKGAMLITRSAPRKKYDEIVEFIEPIFTPQSLPKGYKETKSGHIRKVKPKPDPTEQKTIVPPRPSGKESTQDAVATHVSMSQYLLGTINKKSIKDEDSVEILRSYGALPDMKGVGFVSKLYEKTQPITILDTTTTEEYLGSTKCPRCGLKLCQCTDLQNPPAKKHRPPTD